MASTAYAWTFGLLTLFGIGVVFIVFSQVFDAHLIPEVSTQITESDLIDSETKQESLDGISQYQNFFRTFPFFLFIIVLIYMFVAAIRREGEAV